MTEMNLHEYYEKIKELTEKKDASGLMSIIENNKGKNVLAAAIRGLGELKANEAVDLLIYIALKRNWAKVRHAAISALGQIGDDIAIKPLILLLKDVDYEVTDPKDGDYCYDIKGFMPGAIIGALCDIGSPEAVDRIVEALDENNKLAEVAIQALKEKGEKGIFPLISLFECDDHLTVRRAVVALGELGRVAQPAVEHLISLLVTSDSKDNPDFSLMEDIAVALGKTKASEAVGPLLQILQPDPLHTDPGYRLQNLIIFALGDIGDKQATKRLVHLMIHCTELRVRGTAAIALGQIRDEEAIEPLIKVIGSKREEGWARDCAFKALFNYSGDVAAVPILRYLKEYPAIIKHDETLTLEN